MAASVNTTSSLWDQAQDRLDDEAKIRLKSIHPGKLEILDEIAEVVSTRQDECLRKRWKFKRSTGEQIIVRDLFAKIARWISKFREIGDIAVQYDPVHASLPWAGVRLLLQIAVNDVETFGAMIEGLERISSLITRFAIFECLYLQGQHQAKHDLEIAMVHLYEAILVYLLKAEQYYNDNTMKRAIRSIAQTQTTGVDHLLRAIDERERHVGRWSALIQQEDQTQTTEAALRIEALLKSLEQPLIRAADQIQDLHDNLSKERRRDVLQWLSKVPIRQHQRAMTKDVLPDTGQWLLNHSKYKSWLESSSSSLLWLHGIPGSGKTKLASICVQEILRQSRTSPSSAPVAYFYCARLPSEPERMNPDEIANALLKQLTAISVDEPICPLVLNEYLTKSEETEYDGLESIRLDIGDCTRLMLELFDRTPATIIIDALDECDPKRRHEVFHLLQEVLERANNVVKILVTSRDDADIIHEFAKFPTIPIAAASNHEDIERFVEHHIMIATQNRTLLHGKLSGEGQQKVREALVDGAQGMFRWVSLQMQQLCDPSRMKTEEDIELALTQLPETLAELYANVYNSITRSASQARTLAQSAIGWLLCAQRPLSPAQLLTVSSKHMKQPATHEQLLDVCCNLVVFDTDGDGFLFAHLSVREYFEHHQDFNQNGLHAAAAEHCLNLLADRFASSPNWDQQSMGTRMFLKYATLYWPAHYSLIDPEYRQYRHSSLLRTFIIASDHRGQTYLEQWTGLCRTYSKYLDFSDPLRARLEATCAGSKSPQFLAAAFNILEAAEPLKLSNLRLVESWMRNESGQGCIHVAASFGNAEMITLLCDIDQNLCEAEDKNKTKPLIFAASHGHIKARQILLSYGALPDWHDASMRTPLIHAASNGHLEMCRYLIESGADIEHRAGLPFGPLGYAAKNGHVNIVKLLHDCGADIDREELEKYTVLSWVADGGITDSVQYLLDHGAAIDAEDEYGQTPLARAAAAGHETTVKLLLERGAGSDLRDKCGHTPLSRAAWHGQPGVAALLLDVGVSIDTQDEEGRTPISWAAGNGHAAVVSLLLKAGANDKLQDWEGRTPMWWAEQNEQERIEHLLLKANNSRQPISSAANTAIEVPIVTAG